MPDKFERARHEILGQALETMSVPEIRKLAHEMEIEHRTCPTCQGLMIHAVVTPGKSTTYFCARCL
jgi:hypothetical protein